jgi:hypothetical protein
MMNILKIGIRKLFRKELFFRSLQFLYSLISKFFMPAYSKKIFSVIVLFSFFFKSFAPTSEALIIIDSPPVEPYKRLIYAIGMVETKFDTLAYNPVENAVGYFQIRPIRLLDYNIRTGNNYSREDLYDYKVSEKIFLYYASEIGPYDYERIARNWNGSGKNTYLYWKQVKKYL